ncbi:phage antirepressor KilAC domain-containing protein [Rothia terrae]|uniref:Phage antirepressor KilAC domain-containing protein n=1 Tax=Rothia terrae TaxID=396015 RepID=A0A7H2BGE6_9MICC|nr:phage antirepressor KilAC domain-containing protein [Rothia terrae]QNV38742.1 phage antirepressor KilAC domain-containing protein [Rothia terrae]
MNTIQVLDFQGHGVRTEVRDNKLTFALSDVCSVLGDANPSNVVKRVRESSLHIVEVDTGYGVKPMNFVDERGLIRILQTSRSPLVESFQDWADERVEQLLSGKTVNAAGVVGGEDAIIAQAMGILDARVKAAEHALAIAAPKAQVYDDYMTSDGSHSVAQAAGLLTQSGIVIGQTRLFAFLDNIKWTYKRGKTRQIMQYAREQGLLVYRARTYPDPITGERKTADPQIRVTPKGLEKLRIKLLPPLTEELAA